MNKRQLFIIVGIVIAPVIVGYIILSIKSIGADDQFQLSSSQKKIGLVKIIDIIYSSENYVNQLREFRRDKSVAGVLVRIDSPGGAVAPAQEIYEEMKRFAVDQKPLIVSMGNIAASGGYYIASPAKKIFANPGTLTGSIGVIMQFPQYHKLFDKIGIKMTTFKAGDLKDIGNPHREFSEDEKEFLQQMINNTHEQFIQDVSKARDMDINKLRLVADGRILNGQQALAAGLVDSLGGFTCALSYLKGILNLPEKAKIIENKSRQGFFRELLTKTLIKNIPFVNKTPLPAGNYFLLKYF